LLAKDRVECDPERARPATVERADATVVQAEFVLEEGPTRQSMKMWDGDVSLLAWDVASPRAPSIHFAHANGFNALTYRSLFDPLALDFRIHASDLRGHGQTTLAANPKGMRSWLIYRDDILRTLEGLDGRPKLLVGHSMGATASLAAALAKPGWVTGLVLVEPVIMLPPQLRRLSILRMFGLLDRVHPMVKQAARRRGVWPSRDDMFEAYRGRGAFRTWPEEVVRDYVNGGSLDYMDYQQVRLACTPGWETANYRAGPPNLWRDIGKLKVPTTLIVGGHRSTCPEPVIELLLQKQKLLRVIRVPQASHFLPMEFPGIVRDEIRLIAGLSE
jgi:pimeloyl-ACP methyl ester carboxylesterase